MTTPGPDYRFLATHDPMTGLPNRLGWDEAIEPRRAVIEAGGPFAVGVSDLNDFKAVNEILGHPKGDDVIRAFGEILMANTRHDTSTPHTDIAAVARSGGDEMWLLLDMTPRPYDGIRRGSSEHLTLSERVDVVVDRIRTAFDGYVMSDEELRDLRLGVSIGTALARPNVTVEQLMQEADDAAHQDKLGHLPELSPYAVDEMHIAVEVLQDMGISLRQLPLYLEKYPNLE